MKSIQRIYIYLYVFDYFGIEDFRKFYKVTTVSINLFSAFILCDTIDMFKSSKG